MYLHSFHIKRLSSFACFVLLLALLPYVSFAQQKTQSGVDPLEISVDPSAPSPGAKTTITIASSVFDISQATIIWSVNGTPLLSGDGARVFAFTMGPSGKSTIVTLSVSPRSSTPFTRTFTFTPGAVTLLWEAQAYTPALYQGKPLYSAGSNIRVLALPQVTDAGGKPLQSADLNFKWQINGDAHADLSGIGRDTLDFTGSLLGGNEEVSVDILRRDGSKAAQGYTVVHDENPVVLLYKKDPLRGTLYNQALSGDVPLVDTETTIIAEPYFMSGTSRSSKDLAYEWQLNGAVVQPQGNDPSVLTLRRVGNESGNATLTLSLQNMDKSKLLQQANATLNIILDAARSTIFGQ